MHSLLTDCFVSHAYGLLILRWCRLLGADAGCSAAPHTSAACRRISRLTAERSKHGGGHACASAGQSEGSASLGLVLLGDRRQLAQSRRHAPRKAVGCAQRLLAQLPCGNMAGRRLHDILWQIAHLMLGRLFLRHTTAPKPFLQDMASTCRVAALSRPAGNEWQKEPQYACCYVGVCVCVCAGRV